MAGLLARDKALEAEATSIEQVERLVRYHRDLVRLCTNFVNFEDFYDGRPAIFQYGTLYLDQRACHLCLPVADAAKHATMAGLAGAFLAYLDCTRPATGEKVQIVAAFTAGDSDNLMVGRNGVFYDRQGRDWDATITKIVDNPISIRQAFWSPYKKFVRLLEEQVAKRAAAADAESHGTLSDGGHRRPPTSATSSRPRPRRSTSARSPRWASPSAPSARSSPPSSATRRGSSSWAPLATAGRLRRDHAAHLAAVGGAGVHQAAQAQPRPDPRRQRLGGEHAREDQRPVRRHVEQRRQAAARLPARHQRSLRREDLPLEVAALRRACCSTAPTPGGRGSSIASSPSPPARRRSSATVNATSRGRQRDAEQRRADERRRDGDLAARGAGQLAADRQAEAERLPAAACR